MTQQKRIPAFLLAAEGILCVLIYLLAGRLPTQSSFADSTVFLIRFVMLASLALTVAAFLVFACFQFRKKGNLRILFLFSYIAAGVGYVCGLLALGGMIFVL